MVPGRYRTRRLPNTTSRRISFPAWKKQPTSTDPQGKTNRMLHRSIGSRIPRETAVHLYAGLPYNRAMVSFTSRRADSGSVS